MNSAVIAVIVFACVFGSAVLGLSLGRALPDRHLNHDAREIVKLATGLIATLSALVLGLLVSSAKGTFDQVNHELTQNAVRIIVLDRALAQYGPEAKEVRATINASYVESTSLVMSGNEAEQKRWESAEGVARVESIQAAIRALAPKNEAQKELQLRAIQASNEIASSRWFLIVQREGTISIPLLVIMVFWLSVIFAAWGVFSPRNLVVVVALLAASISVAGATFLILEMDTPLTGWIRVSSVPIQKAISHLGQ
ncbi:MAG TPA: hypothetical protein VGN86_18575 [Pyrinomonadaceae bacterium]|jgi:hypothetical protein|nr:hypothetical protein [Pyrinomonadaceae bacterium]